MELQARLRQLSSEIPPIYRQLLSMAHRLEKQDAMCPREFKIYERLVRAYEELEAAIRECQEAQP